MRDAQVLSYVSRLRHVDITSDTRIPPCKIHACREIICSCCDTFEARPIGKEAAHMEGPLYAVFAASIWEQTLHTYPDLPCFDASMTSFRDVPLLFDLMTLAFEHALKKLD